MNRCGAFETSTGRQCTLGTDHEGAHVMESPIGRMCFDDMTESDIQAILEARRGKPIIDHLRRENKRLREHIKVAPHGMGCHSIQDEFFNTPEWGSLEFCNCWKIAALGEEG